MEVTLHPGGGTHFCLVTESCKSVVVTGSVSKLVSAGCWLSNYPGPALANQGEGAEGEQRVL